jgi:hypothetical protein
VAEVNVQADRRAAITEWTDRARGVQIDQRRDMEAMNVQGRAVGALAKILKPL